VGVGLFGKIYRYATRGGVQQSPAPLTVSRQYLMANTIDLLAFCQLLRQKKFDQAVAIKELVLGAATEEYYEILVKCCPSLKTICLDSAKGIQYFCQYIVESRIFFFDKIKVSCNTMTLQQANALIWFWREGMGKFRLSFKYIMPNKVEVNCTFIKRSMCFCYIEDYDPRRYSYAIDKLWIAQKNAVLAYLMQPKTLY
jgi:hypothetical protein